MSKRLSGLFFILTALVTVFIFSRSLKPVNVSSAESDFFVNIVIGFFNVNKEILSNIIRKTAHCFEFFVQGSCLALAFVCSKKYYERIIYILFCGLFTAVTDEFLQLFSEGRGSMVSDVFIDFSGTCIAVILFTLIWYFIKKKAN